MLSSYTGSINIEAHWQHNIIEFQSHIWMSVHELDFDFCLHVQVVWYTSSTRHPNMARSRGFQVLDSDPVFNEFGLYLLDSLCTPSSYALDAGPDIKSSTPTSVSKCSRLCRDTQVQLGRVGRLRYWSAAPKRAHAWKSDIEETTILIFKILISSEDVSSNNKHKLGTI